ncbi:MAG: ABC transporter permease [Bacteroidota bacterium]|nr:ABC transporter permease [Bacteroidota bacterium]
MKVLKFLIEKEFKQMFRNPLIANLIVFFPTMVLLVFPWTITFEVNNIRVDVVDHGKGSYARRLTDKVEASPYFILNDTPPDYETAMQAMERGEIDMIVEIPHTFDRDIVKQQSSRVGLAVNSVNGSVGLLGSNYMTQIVNDLSKELANELLHKTSHAKIQALPSLPRLTIEQRYRFNPQMDYKLFMIPGFFVIILTILCGILPALNIVLEKENGTIHQINVTPVQKAWFILAKLIPYWTIGLIAFIIAISVAYLIYGLWPAGSIFTVLFSGIVFIISVSGMGIIISNYSETLQQAAFLVIFFILIIILLSGMFTPISSMPVWAQAIASINPFTYLTSTLRMVYLNGSSLADVSTNLLMLALFSLLLNGWAVLSYKKRG